MRANRLCACWAKADSTWVNSNGVDFQWFALGNSCAHDHPGQYSAPFACCGHLMAFLCSNNPKGRVPRAMPVGIYVSCLLVFPDTGIFFALTDLVIRAMGH